MGVTLAAVGAITPRYFAIATPKHFAVHSGPEPTRHFADVDVSKHDEVDTYEPAFRAAIVEGKAGSVMCACAINSEPACANQYLLQHQLRGNWGFQGYVSDCDALLETSRPIIAIVRLRRRAPRSQCSAEWITNASLSLPDSVSQSEKAYIDAVQQGYLPENVLDTALIRLFSARIKLGMFDPPDVVPYAKIDEKELDSGVEHRAEARKAGKRVHEFSSRMTVCFPLKPGIRKITVVGPLADQTRPLIGNYAGQPTHIVSILDGLHAEFPNATISFVPGAVPSHGWNRGAGSSLTTPEGKPGLKADYNEGAGRG